ncbi:hypothetical protein BayCH28_11415 [Mycolicibacterium sp. CH28]|uniref:hypothetical protein n=1 Tax=Mycolicibacterium sp. CH28 TaxID=2512237 RepID=UPI001081DC86|nr:hypothetical protein [Mycolicibacterium sp. CH28]TGD88348.1 hypothetical protein BayCH28_11415 [Mycolicibacterium sp. CH28]
MRIVPTSIAQHIDRIDRQRSLAIGISSAALAFWSFYRVIWSMYLAVTYDFVFGSLVVPIILWGVIGVVAAVAAVAFLTRYAKGPTADDAERGDV